MQHHKSNNRQKYPPKPSNTLCSAACRSPKLTIALTPGFVSFSWPYRHGKDHPGPNSLSHPQQPFAMLSCWRSPVSQLHAFLQHQGSSEVVCNVTAFREEKLVLWVLGFVFPPLLKLLLAAP